MRTQWLFLLGIPTVVAFAHCSGGQGGVGQACYANGTCNTGLTCLSNLCVEAGDAAAPDASQDVVTQDVSVNDAASETSTADASDGGFSMASLPNLVLWLDAAKGVTVKQNLVSQWNDQTANHNDASATTGKEGTLVTGALNGLPAVQLGSSSLLTIGGNNGSPTIAFGTGEFFVEVVASFGTGGNASYFFITKAGNSEFDFFGNNTNLAAGVSIGGTFVLSSVFAAGFHRIGCHRSGTGASTTMDVRVDGAVSQSKMGTNIAADLQSLVAGQIGGGMLLQITELVAVKGAITSGDVDNVEAYFKSKYAL